MALTARCILYPLLFSLFARQSFSAVPGRTPRVHTIITTECGQYFSWQSIGFFYSFRKIGQPGNLTRVMCCTESALKDNPLAQIVPTHIAPDYTHHPTNGDVYLAYNKPLAVIDWINKTNPDTDYVIVIDADMIMMRPLEPWTLGVEPGIAVAAYFDYLKGTFNELADKHIPEIPIRNNTWAGRKNRRSDQCGGFTIMTKDDISNVAPLWLKYTEDVRFDPDGWRLTGDVYATKPGLRPWIAEMYGYSYGAAKAGVWHKAHRSAMLYPGYDSVEAPYVLHYGLDFKIPDTSFEFDKHWYLTFDALACPPWDMANPGRPAGGLFPHPPKPSDIKSEEGKRYRDMLAISVVNTLNEAFCERHYENCPPSEELDTECGKVHDIALAVQEELIALEEKGIGKCKDFDGLCAERLSKNECEDNTEFMQAWCRKTCGFCREDQWRVRKRFIADWQKRFMKEDKAAVKAVDGAGRKGLGKDAGVAEDLPQKANVNAPKVPVWNKDAPPTDKDAVVEKIKAAGLIGNDEADNRSRPDVILDGVDRGADGGIKDDDDGTGTAGGSVRRRVKQEAETVLDLENGDKHWGSLILQIHGFGALMWVGLFVLFIMLAPRVRKGRVSPFKPKQRKLAAFGRLDSM